MEQGGGVHVWWSGAGSLDPVGCRWFYGPVRSAVLLRLVAVGRLARAGVVDSGSVTPMVRAPFGGNRAQRPRPDPRTTTPL